MTPGATLETPVERFAGGSSHLETDTLAVEEPLELQLGYGALNDRRWKSISVTMRTPGNDFELSAGFLMTEGVVRDPDDIDTIRYVSLPESSAREKNATQERWPIESARNIVRVELTPGVEVSLATLERNFYMTSSCGVCGKASLLALRAVCPPRQRNEFRFDVSMLSSLSERLRSSQEIFGKTGGLHAAGLFDSAGNLCAIREDVGRHNAVDKLLGAQFLEDKIPLRDRLLMLSGRASFELLQKALMGGIPMVVSVGAPSSLAVRIAKDFDITLVGFLRNDSFNVYHGADHLMGEARTGGRVEAAH